MNFSDFKVQFQANPIIFSRDVARNGKKAQIMRNQLHRWQKKGLLICLRKGAYLLNKNDRKVDVDPNAVANILYEPSYISLEYALNYYGLIPERVADITSVTTRKTMRFSNELGKFIYQHIKPQVFRGFKKFGEDKNSFFMAEPEKSVVDFLYLNLSQFQSNPREILEKSHRFQNIEELNPKRMVELGKVFENKKLMRIIKEMVRWIEEVNKP